MGGMGVVGGVGVGEVAYVVMEVFFLQVLGVWGWDVA